MDNDNLEYLEGFGNEFKSEADGYEGALPVGRKNPQKCNYGLVAEQLSGSSFTAPTSSNKRSWLYKLRPSVCHKKFRRLSSDKLGFNSRFRFDGGEIDCNQKRWIPYKSEILDNHKVDFVNGIHTLAYSDSIGCPSSSLAIHIYLANANMENKSFMNCDGDFLIVPQEGKLYITTEFGHLSVEPNEIVVIQQGMKFSVSSKDKFMRGYILEVSGNHFELPYRGPIGANGLADPGDFKIPKARIDDKLKLDTKHDWVVKFVNQLFIAKLDHSPFDVAAWSGNYTPYKYCLNNFVSMNSVSVDHPDPSIFTVLTCPSIGKPGTALADFVIFPPRWDCATDTFRPPYFHRNCMTEFMGIIKGKYVAKSDKFAPGGGSLHQSMIPHGPDWECYKVGVKVDTSKPERVADDSMSFMFETCLTLNLTEWALKYNVDEDYIECWEKLSIIDHN